MTTIDGQKSAPILLLGFVIALFIASSFIPAKWFGIEPAKQTYQKIDLSQAELKDIATDANKDGTISWKEIITSNSDPSSTAYDVQQQVDPKVVAELNDPNNLTASFSKNLYLASAYLKKNNITDASAQQDVINQLIQQEADKAVAKTYGIKDIAVSNTESKESIVAYGNSVAVILKDMVTQKSITDDMTAIETFLESKDDSALLPLEQDYTEVNGKLQKLLALPVPPSAVTYHLIAVNRVSAYADVLYNLSRASEDPMRSTVSIQHYPDASLSVLKLVSSFSGYFSIQKVMFTPKEPGYIFTAGYTFK